MKWLEALNKDDVDPVSTVYTPSTVQIDAFGRAMSVNPKSVQAVHKKGIILTTPIDGAQALRGTSSAGIACGTFTSKVCRSECAAGTGELGSSIRARWRGIKEEARRSGAKRTPYRRCTTDRDFVPWRFSDAGCQNAWIVSEFRRPITCTIGGISQVSLPNRSAKRRTASGGLRIRSGVLTRRLRCPLYFFQLFSCAP